MVIMMMMMVLLIMIMMIVMRLIMRSTVSIFTFTLNVALLILMLKGWGPWGDNMSFRRKLKIMQGNHLGIKLRDDTYPGRALCRILVHSWPDIGVIVIKIVLWWGSEIVIQKLQPHLLVFLDCYWVKAWCSWGRWTEWRTKHLPRTSKSPRSSTASSLCDHHHPHPHHQHHQHPHHHQHNQFTIASVVISQRKRTTTIIKTKILGDLKLFRPRPLFSVSLVGKQGIRYVEYVTEGCLKWPLQTVCCL